ncbi:MATE family efflux transporter [Halomicrococcus gelatinilyticus]|uniref:MATE family efflux transporter n=1 Tax=Halomicrococcus gelatinilyticus TaxID=1702103 RepID=UPI002E0DF34C
MLDVSRDEITDGSLTRALLVLAAPLVAQNLVQVGQQVIDTFWLGRLGEDSVAAVGLNFPITALLLAAFVGITIATQVLVSQRVGAEDPAGARRAAFHGIVLSFGIGVALTVLVWLLAADVVALFGVEPSVAELATTYLATYALGFPLMASSDAIEMGFVGWGDSRAALYINVTAVVVNVVLDPVLIFGYGIPGFEGLAIRGAALATVVGYASGFGLAFAMFLRGRDGYTLTRSAATFRLDDARELVAIGLPRSGQHAASQSARVLMIAIAAAAGGSAALAAYNVGGRIASIAFIPASGLAQAAQSVVGQNVGADKPARASRATWLGAGIAAGGLSLVGVVQWFVPGLLTSVFVPDMTQQGLAYTVDYLQILVFGYWGIGAMYLFNAGFNGARRTRTTMVADLLKYWGVRLPVAAAGVALLDFGAHAVFWAVTVSNVIGAVGMGTYYYYTSNNGLFERAADVASSPAD